MQDANAR